MTEYLIICILLILCIFIRKKTALILTCLYMLYIGCFRAESVGTDVELYHANFSYSTFNPKSWNAGTYFEIGFTYIMLFFKYYIAKNYMAFVSFLFLYTFGITCWFFFKYSKLPALSIFAFYVFGAYFFSMNGMRQAFAFATCLIALNYYIKSKNTSIYTILILLISFALHNSCIIFFTIPFLDKIPQKYHITKKRIYILIGISLIFATVLKGIFLNIIGNLIPLMGRFSTYIINAQDQGSNMILFVSIAGLITVYFTQDIKNRFFIIYIFGIISYNLLASFSPTAPRMALHLTFLCGICYSMTYNQLKGSAKKWYLIAILALGIFHFSYAYLSKGYEGIKPYIPRKSMLSYNQPSMLTSNERDNHNTIKI